MRLFLLLLVPLMLSGAEPFVLPGAADLVEVSRGHQFTEGPAWDPRGAWIFSDIPRDQLWRIPSPGLVPSAGSATLAQQPSGKTNGNWIDPQARRFGFRHAARDVVRQDPDGTTVVLCATFAGKTLNSPNDGCRQGEALWFTDPAWGLEGRPAEQPVRGVYRLDDGATEPVLMIAGLDQPNGLCFSPDGGTLYVAESGPSRRIHAWSLSGAALAPGQGDLGRVFAVPAQGGPDGMRCDDDGRLYAACGDGVEVFAPDGRALGLIPTPNGTTNCAFGGPDRRTLLITAGGSVYAVRVPVPGR